MYEVDMMVEELDECFWELITEKARREVIKNFVEMIMEEVDSRIQSEIERHMESRHGNKED